MTQTADIGNEPESRIDGLMDKYRGAVPGASLVVLRDGAPIVRRAYGLSDVEHGTAATPATNYRLASMTKQFTAAAILLLAEDGRLSIDDPVRRWLPTLPDSADGMVIRHLLAHRSGVLDYEGLIPGAASAQMRMPMHSRCSRRRTTVTLPQERAIDTATPATFCYRSSPLGRRVWISRRFCASAFFGRWACATRLPLLRAVRDPASRLRLQSRGPRLGANRPKSDQRHARRWRHLFFIDDLGRWDAALADERLLQAASLRLAFGAATLTEDPKVQYGFGWRITGDTLWHTGETIGFQSVILRFVAHRLTVILLTNRNDAAPYPTALAIAKLFLPVSAEVPPAHPASGPDPGLRPRRRHEGVGEHVHSGANGIAYRQS